MDVEAGKRLLRELISDLSEDSFTKRVREAKTIQRLVVFDEIGVRADEARRILRDIDGLPPNLVNALFTDPRLLQPHSYGQLDRLRALIGHCKRALKWLEAGAIVENKKGLQEIKDISGITSKIPGLQESIESRWLEVQRCQYVRSYLSAVILMGSILEGLLYARAHQNLVEAEKAQSAPKTKTGNVKRFRDWTLNDLIDVAVELGWLKSDRGDFSSSLRKYRNLVHPLEEVQANANVDEHTCKTCWLVLTVSVSDLLASLE